MQELKDKQQNEYYAYIVVTKSRTYFSRLIHFATNDEFTHTAIGLDGIDGKFYCFGRRFRYTYLPAGFTNETIDDRYDAYRIYRIKITKEQYDYIRSTINRMYRRRLIYPYNIIGVFSAYAKLGVHRSHHYFCSQFVATILSESGAVKFKKSVDLIRPNDLSRIKKAELVYIKD